MKRKCLRPVVALGVVLGCACGARAESLGEARIEELIVIGVWELGGGS